MATLMPYESFNPQFDDENHRTWEEFREREPYVEEHGLIFLPAKRKED